MSVALYPGSFNPWHDGHQDILEQAVATFDKVVVLICQNPEKPKNEDFLINFVKIAENLRSDKVIVHHWDSTILSYLVDWIGPNGNLHGPMTHMIRGLRNGTDLEYEMVQKYIHEDTGNDLIFTCFLSDRGNRHKSSSAIRMLDKLGLEHGYTTF